MSYQYPFAAIGELCKRVIWNKGKEITQKGERYDPQMWRYDICGNVMRYADHGNIGSKYGWEIDHVKPSSKGGSDEMDNLQPLNWNNNREKGDAFPGSC